MDICYANAPKITREAYGYSASGLSAESLRLGLKASLTASSVVGVKASFLGLSSRHFG